MAIDKLKILNLELDVLREQEKSMTGFFNTQEKNEIKLQKLAKERQIAEEQYNKLKLVGSKASDDAIKKGYEELQQAEKAIAKEKEINRKSC